MKCNFKKWRLCIIAGGKLLNLVLAFVMSVSVLCTPALAVNSRFTAIVDQPKISEEHVPDASRKNGDDLVGEIRRFISDIVVPFGNDYTINGCDEVQLGMAIPTYIMEENFNSQSYYNIAEVQYYPVFSEENVIGLVGVAQDGAGDYVFSYSEGYSEQVNSVLADNAQIALIGDGRSLKAVASSEQVTGIRSETSGVNPAEELSTISITGNAEEASRSSRAGNLAVSTKFQSDNWDCWAACVACIGQYYTGINKSSIQVADAVGIHTYASAGQTRDAIQSVYHVSTTYYEGSLSVSGVMDTISNDRKPILAGVVFSGYIGHMVVINGWTVVGTSPALSFMDPAAGPTMATLSTSYPIMIPLGGNMYTMQEYII